MSHRLGTHKDIEARARKMRKKGWVFELSGSNRILVKPPGDDHVLLTGSQTGSSSSTRHFLRHLDRAEHEWEEQHPVEAGLVDLPYEKKDD